MEDYELDDVSEISVILVDGQPIVFQGEGIYVLRDWLNSVLEEPGTRVRQKKVISTRGRKKVPPPEEEYSSSPEEEPSPPRTRNPSGSRNLKDRGGYSSVGVNYQKGAGSAKEIAAQMRAQAENSGFQFQ